MAESCAVTFNVYVPTETEVFEVITPVPSFILTPLGGLPVREYDLIPLPPLTVGLTEFFEVPLDVLMPLE